VRKSRVRIAKDELNLCISIGQVADIDFRPNNIGHSVVYETTASRGAVNRVRFSRLEALSGIFGSDNARNTEFTGNDRSMARATTPVSNYRRCDPNSRNPIRICHICNKNFSRFHRRDSGEVGDNASLATRSIRSCDQTPLDCELFDGMNIGILLHKKKLTNGDTFDDFRAVTRNGNTGEAALFLSRPDSLRASLDDKEFSCNSVLLPFQEQKRGALVLST
jgi:hypothetical protein